MSNDILNWYGSFSQGAGYSGSSEKLCLALERQGADIRLVWFNRGDLEVNMTPQGQELKKKPFKLGDVGICYGLPNAFSSLRNKINIGFTMFETDKLPRTDKGNDWSGKTGQPEDNINNLDMLLVPSVHNKKIFEQEGVTVPIEVVHLGVDTEHYEIIERPKRDTFTFLMYGVLTLRKNPGAAVSAFLDLFKDRDDVRIIFKTHSGTLGHIQMPYDNVKIIDEYTTPDRMKEYLYEADAFVFPSRGEGFGLPPMEAMATGLPAIFTDCTGMSEYANPEYNYPVPISGKSEAKRFPKRWGDVGNWYEIDYDKLKETMLHVVNNREEAREKGLKAAQWIRKEWTFDNTAKRILEITEKLKQEKLS